MKKWAIISYLVCLHLLVLVLVRPYFHVSKPKPSDNTAYYNRLVLTHSRIDPLVPKGAVIFVGASGIQGLCVSAVTSPSVNFGIGSDTTAGLLKRLPVYKSINRASCIVMDCISANDMVRGIPVDQIVMNYKAIFQAIPVPVIASLIYPMRNGERASEINARIREIKGPTWIDMDWAKDFLEEDGVHLNSEGYRRWVEVLKKAISTHAPSRQTPDSKTGPA